MPFKSFAHLARVSLAKGITHAYAPAAVAGQSIGGQFHNTSVGKLSKTSHLQNVFTGSSSSGAGARAKTSHASQSGGSGDAGLAQYYAAWQHAQQTGDDTDWRQQQFARRIGWKQSEKTSEKPATPSRPSHQRLDSIRAVDILRPTIKQNRGYSESALADIRDADQTLTEEEALAKVDEAIAIEVQIGHDAVVIADTAASLDETSATNDAAEHTITDDQSVGSETQQSSSTRLTSPSIGEARVLSEKIVSLGRSHRFAEIPQYFESMVREGLVPSVDAYNQIITAAIKLSTGYQPYPRALEVYGDMTSRSVKPNRETYQILISFLTKQSLEAFSVQKDLAAQRMRHGSFMLPSVLQRDELYSGDVSLQFASKFYNIAASSIADFGLRESQYNSLLRACALSGDIQKMSDIADIMRDDKVPIRLELYTTAIDACASKGDIELAKTFYAEYRDRAIGRILEPLDVKVYVSLVRAFFAAGQEDKGTHFYEQILASFEGSADKLQLIQQVTDAFVVEGLVQHHVETGEYQDALNSLELYTLSEPARIRAINKICTSAADHSDSKIASDIIALMKPSEISADAARAVTAMHLRSGSIENARDVLTKAQSSNGAQLIDINLATMYALSHIEAGITEEGLAHVRTMFRQIRTIALSQSPFQISRTFDEAISTFAHMMARVQSTTPAHASILIFRLMIENGGLIPAVTHNALAQIGPDCVNQLSPQDIALALHVQAYILPTQASMTGDVAQPERFTHLLETVLNRGILMDPSTLHAVTDALPRLNGARPDLEQRWRDLMRPTSGESTLVSPLSPASPHLEQPQAVSAFDPYANTTDHRASRVISDLLESTSGRLENHISDAMARLRNVRRMGRHLQYGTYAKLISTAGKAKQSNLMHEVLGMAQTDIPLDTQIPAVKAGWISIYDSMVAACLTVGDRQMATKYHQEIRNMGAAPSANTFGIYITTLEGTFDEATEAVKIFQQAMSEGVAPSVFLYNAVIGKLGKARRIDDCLQYFAQMQNQGIRPSSVTYGTLVNALCRTSEESFAVEMFDEMEAATNYRPRPAPYNSIIQYFLNTKRDRTKVLQYYGRMRSKGISPTSHTYKLLIEAYATLEPVNLTAAETMLEDMKANGIQPEAVHYGSLIHAKGCVLHDMEGAHKVFDSVLADGRIRPTDNLYQNLLESMVANHDVEKTGDILKDMERRGIQMTPYIANTLIHGWAGKGDIDKARSIYEQLGNSNREPSTYEAMIRAFLAVNDHAGANSVVTEMLGKGYPSAVSEKMLALVGGAF